MSKFTFKLLCSTDMFLLVDKYKRKKCNQYEKNILLQFQLRTVQLIQNDFHCIAI